MTIDRRRLQRIIKEELGRMMHEMDFDEPVGGTQMTPGMEPVGEEIDWSKFGGEGAEALWLTFSDTLAQLRAELGVEPTAVQVMTRMQSLLSDASGEEDENAFLAERRRHTNLTTRPRRR